MTDYSVTVTGVAVDLGGVMFSTAAYYNGESFFSFVFSESDVAGRAAENVSTTLYKQPVWFTNLWRSDDGRVFVCDGDGRMHHGTDAGDSWVVHDVSERALTAVWGFAADSVFAGGSAGVIYQWEGVAWRAISDPLGNTLTGIAGYSPTDLYVCGEGALFLHYDGATWTPIELPTNRNLVGILPLAETDVLVSGSGGTLFRGADDTWADLSQPGPNLFEMTFWRDEIYIGGGGDGLFVFDGNALRNVKSTLPVYSLTSNVDYLVAPGDNEAARFDGAGWYGPTYT